jgi:hypothetical protein
MHADDGGVDHLDSRIMGRGEGVYGRQTSQTRSKTILFRPQLVSEQESDQAERVWGLDHDWINY